jgi:hypothetical protein
LCRCHSRRSAVTPRASSRRIIPLWPPMSRCVRTRVSCVMVRSYLHVYKFTDLVLQDGVLQAFEVAAGVETGAAAFFLQVGRSTNRGWSDKRPPVWC